MKALMCPRKVVREDVTGDEDLRMRETRKETKISCAAKPFPLKKKTYKT